MKFKESLFLLPVFWSCCFIVLPLLYVFLLSLSEMNYEKHPAETIFDIFYIFDTINLRNYIHILSDHIYLEIFSESLVIALYTTGVTFVIAYPVALSIVNCDERIRNFLLVLIVIPFWTSLLIRVYSWIVILKNDGLLENFLKLIGINIFQDGFLYSKFAVIIGVSYSYLPFMILPIYSSLEKINVDIYEAASDLGASPIQTFFNITLPLSTSGIITGSMLTFIPAIGELVIPELLGGAKTFTISKLLWTEFFNNRDWPVAAALAIMITVIILVLVYFILKIIEIRNEKQQT